MKPNSLPTCPIHFSLSHLGDKWTLLILRDLLFYKKKRYNDFLSSKEAISTNILADRLKRLEGTGLLTKERDPDNGKQYLYRPTRKCLDLLPTLVEVMIWGVKYADGIEPEVEESILQFVMADKQRFIQKIEQRFAPMV